MIKKIIDKVKAAIKQKEQKIVLIDRQFSWAGS